MELVHTYESNIKMLSDIFSIISYISSAPNALKTFHTSGWNFFQEIKFLHGLVCDLWHHCTTVTVFRLVGSSCAVE